MQSLFKSIRMFLPLSVFLLMPAHCAFAIQDEVQTGPSVLSDEIPIEKIEEYANVVASAAYGTEDKFRNAMKKFFITGEVEGSMSLVFMNSLNGVMRKKEMHEPLFRLTNRLIVNDMVMVERETLREYLIMRLVYLYEDNEVFRAEIETTIDQLASNDKNDRYKKIFERTKRGVAKEAALKSKFSDVEIKFFEPQKALPNPVTQKPKERTQTLFAQINEASKLLSDGNEVDFVKRFVDPVLFANKDVAADEAARGFLVNFDRFRPRVLEEFRKQQRGLVWQLEGRAARCEEQVELIWVYREGRWYLNPLTMFGSGPKAKEQPIDFFSSTSKIPSFDWGKLDTPAKKLESLRETQQKTLEMLKSCNAFEFAQSVACPVEMVKQAAGAKRTVEGMAGMIALMPKSRSDGLIKSQQKEIERQLKEEPVFRLDGRVAIFESGKDGPSEVQWHFYEGRWRLKLGP